MKSIKQLLFIGAFAIFIFSSFSLYRVNYSKIGLAKVNKMNGIEVYFMSEPLRKYKVIVASDGILGNASVKSLATAGLMTPTPSDKANQLVRNAQKKAIKGGEEIDAVIYSSAKSAVGIKFTDAPNDNTDGIGRVKKINGVDVYAFAEPLVSYEQLSENKAKVRGGAFLTGGILNSSIEDDLSKLVDRAKEESGSKVNELNAVIYSSGKTGIGIRYK